MKFNSPVTSFLVLTICGFFITACSEKNGVEPKPVVPFLEVTVVDQSNGSVAGATVKLFAKADDFYSGSPAFEVKTNQSGKAVFTDPTNAMADSYYVSAASDNLQSLYKGYQQDGVFMSQEEVDSHAYQPGAKVGEPRYKDINADDKIDSMDQTFLDHTELESSKTTAYTITIR